MNTSNIKICVVTGGRDFGDISDRGIAKLERNGGSSMLHQRYKEYRFVKDTLLDYFLANSNDGGNDLMFVFGDSSGVDAIAKEFCIENHIAYKEYKADWDKYRNAKGKNPAGPIRNRKMVSENADRIRDVMAFPGGTGTANCIAIARQHGIEPRQVSL